MPRPTGRPTASCSSCSPPTASSSATRSSSSTRPPASSAWYPPARAARRAGTSSQGPTAFSTPPPTWRRADVSAAARLIQGLHLEALPPASRSSRPSADGSDLRRLTDNPGYDAEATLQRGWQAHHLHVAPRRRFRPLHDAHGRQRADGASPMSWATTAAPSSRATASASCWRASRPKTAEERAAYADLLAREPAIRPMALEIFVARHRWQQRRQLTSQWCRELPPFFFPDGKRILSRFEPRRSAAAATSICGAST